MVRSALVPAVLVTLAGCGGGSHPPYVQPGPAPERRVESRELRSPDARSPFVTAGGGAWRCPSEERIQLAISADGEVSLSSPEMVLASVAPTRAVVNRACDRAAGAGGGAARTGARSGRVGASIVRCDVPPVVLVDFAAGDVTVRAAGGRYVAGAAVRAGQIGVAGYWGAGCAPVSGG
jgi:hypothetical protein